MLTGFEVAGLVVYHTQTIATITTQLKGRLRENPATRNLLDEGQKLAEELHQLIKNETVEVNGELESQLRRLSSKLPGIRALLSDSKSRRDISEAVQQLREELRELEIICGVQTHVEHPITRGAGSWERSRPTTPILRLPEELNVWSEAQQRFLSASAILDPGSSQNLVPRRFIENLDHPASTGPIPVVYSFGNALSRRFSDLLAVTWDSLGFSAKPSNVVSLEISLANVTQAQDRLVRLDFHVQEETDIYLGRGALDRIPTLRSRFGDPLIPGRQKDGLHRIHSPRELAVADVIFVHGLNGDPHGTWKGESNVFWPQDLLANDLEKCSIWTYTYDSNIVMEKQVSEPIKSIVEDLADNLITSVEKATQNHLIWVCHSLGGLLVKTALTRSRLKPGSFITQPIFSRTKGVIFVGTPHTGSALSTRSALFANIMSVFSGHSPGTRHETMIGERRLDSTITLTTSDFAVLMDEEHFPIVSLYETKPMLTEAGPRTIVSSLTRLHHPQESWDYIEGNHLSMCKFDTREEIGYQKILSALRAFRDGIVLQDLQHNVYGRLQSKTGSVRSSLSDAERVDIDSIYSTFRLKVDLPSARWQSSKTRSSTDGTWIRESPYLKEWLTDEKQSPLLIQGPAGCGKTVIAESILEYLRETSILRKIGHRVCQLQIFFKSYQVAQESSPVTVLESLIAQVLDQNNELVRYVDRKSLMSTLRSVERHSLLSAVEPHLAIAVLTSTLRLMLEDTCWVSTYLVFDALDECHPKYARTTIEVLSLLSKIPGIRTVLTTTDTASNLAEWDLMLRNFSEGRSIIRMDLVDDQHGWRAVIKAYIVDRVSEAQRDLRISHAESVDLQDRLIKLPQVSFLVVDLLLQHLQEPSSVSNTDSRKSRWFDTAMAELEDRGDLYHILINLTNRQSRSSIFVLSVLACVFEPLRLQDLVSILQFNKSMQEDIPSGVDEITSELTEQIQGPLQQLVRLDGDGLHLSSDFIRRVVLERMNDASRVAPYVWDEPSRVHLQIAKACLEILLHDSNTVQSNDMKVRSGRVAARSYALSHWEEHCVAAGEAADVLGNLILRWKEVTGSLFGHRSEASELTSSLLKNQATELAGSIFSDIPTTLASLGEEDVTGVLNEEPELTIQGAGLTNRDSRLDPDAKSIDETFRILVSSEEQGEALLASKLANPHVDKSKYLKKAITDQNTDIVNLVLKSLSKTDFSLTSDLLKYAVIFPSRQLVRTLLLRKELFDMEAAFVRAAEIANLGVCEDLLAYGAKIAPNVGPENPSTPLHLAARRGQKDLVAMMLRWNAPVNIRDYHNRTPLHIAAENGHADVVDTLLQNSASVVAEDTKRRTAMFLACACGHKITARQLWLSGSKLSQRDLSQRTMLHAAANTGRESVVEMLLSAGMSPNCHDSHKATPLHEAASRGLAPIVQRLLDAGADVNAADSQGKTALHFACQSRNAPETVIRLLLDRGADPELTTTKSRRIPLLLAAEFSTVRALKMFAARHKQLFFMRDCKEQSAFQIVERYEKSAVDRDEKRNFLLEHFSTLQQVRRYRTNSISDSQKETSKEEKVAFTKIRPHRLNSESVIQKIPIQEKEIIFDSFQNLMLALIAGDHLARSKSQSPALTVSSSEEGISSLTLNSVKKKTVP
jgi:ankyrin repeat protein